MAVTTTPEENEQIIDRFVTDVINGGDDELIEELVAEDVRDHTPFGETRGRDALRETTAKITTAFPDFTVTLEEVVADGDTVAVRMTQRGTHEGEFMGIAPTDRSFEIDAMAFARLEDGRIAERRVLPDLWDLLQQLGVVDPLEPEE